MKIIATLNQCTTTLVQCVCTVVYKVKPKELNPHPDYTGTITMHISIECKDNKYRYLINKQSDTVSEVFKKDITNIVPDCGSMVMSDIVLEKAKGRGN